MLLYRVFDELFRTWSNVAVIRALLDTNTGFTGNEVARVSGMNPRSAFRALTLLEELGIINRLRGGRDHIFSLNRKHFLVQEVILKIFDVENKFPEKVTTTLALILKNKVMSAVIFGSAARREENALSDLDICCIVSSKSNVEIVREILNSNSQMLHDKFGVKLSPVLFTQSEFIKNKKSQLVKNIITEGVNITGMHLKGLLNG